MDTREKIKVMEAHLRGEKIERRVSHSKREDDWVVCWEPLWHWGTYQYRVAPEEEYRQKMVKCLKERLEYVNGGAYGDGYRFAIQMIEKCKLNQS